MHFQGNFPFLLIALSIVIPIPFSICKHIGFSPTEMTVPGLSIRFSIELRDIKIREFAVMTSCIARGKPIDLPLAKTNYWPLMHLLKLLDLAFLACSYQDAQQGVI